MWMLIWLLGQLLLGIGLFYTIATVWNILCHVAWAIKHALDRITDPTTKRGPV